MKKNLLLLPIIACLGLLGSCGDTSSTVTSSETTSEDSSTVTETFITEPTTIEFLVKTGSANSGLIDDYIESFADVEPNVTIEKTEISTGYDAVETKVVNGFAVSDYPDITVCYPDHVANYLDYNKVIDLQDYIDNASYGWDDQDDYVSAFVEPGDEYALPGMYSVPFSKSTEALYYNADALIGLQLAGINDGNAISATYMDNLTWEELFENLCPALETYNDGLADDEKIINPSDVSTDNAIIGYDSEDNLFITLAQQYGYDYTSLDQTTGEGSIDFNNAEMKALCTKFHNYAAAGYLTTGGINSHSGYCSSYFQDRNILMNVGSTGGLAYEYSADFKIGVAQIPQAEGMDAQVISQGPDICLLDHGDDDRALASWLFYKHLTNTDNAKDWALNSTGYMPVRTSVYSDEEYIEYNDISLQTEKTEEMLRALVAHYGEEVAETTYTSPAFKGSSTCRSTVKLLMQEILTSSTDISNIDSMFDAAEATCLLAM
jgi:ABC-type glycerol-3-phosphate transport system substrate-binding protein